MSISSQGLYANHELEFQNPSSFSSMKQGFLLQIHFFDRNMIAPFTAAPATLLHYAA
jgi:hypothetical protein